MIGGDVNLILSMVTLAGLVAMAELQRHMPQHRSREFAMIAAGLGILALVTSARAVASTGILAALPVPANSLAFDTVCWSATLLALVLIVSGVSQWLPIVRDFRRLRSQRLNQLELIKRAHQLSSLESRPHRLLPGFIEQLTSSLGAAGVALLRSVGDECQLIAARGSASGMARVLVRTSLDGKIWRGGLMSDLWRPRSAEPGRATASVLGVPMRGPHDDKYLLLLWPGKEAFDNDLCQNVKIAAEIISRGLQAAPVSSPTGPTANDLTSAAFQKLLAATGDVRDLTRELGGLYMGRGGVSYLSMEIVLGDRVKRYSLGKGGKVLQELGLRPDGLLPHTKTVLESTVAAEFSVLGPGRPRSALERSLGSAENGTVLCIPSTPGQASAVLTLASDRSHAFGSIGASERDMLSVVLTMAMARYTQQQATAQESARLSSIASLVESLASVTSLSESFAIAAESLRQLIGPSVIRIATFSRERSFLTSRALLAQDEASPATPAGGHMILSLMPYHCLVRDHGRLMLVNQDDTDKPISEAEALQAWCSDLKSALIVPVTVNGQVIAVLSLADRRPWEEFRFDHADIAAARMVASLLSISIRASAMTRRPGRVRPQIESMPLTAVAQSPGHSERRAQTFLTEAP
ncbi:MAG: GAF domain-containing protein [bacterium]